MVKKPCCCYFEQINSRLDRLEAVVDKLENHYYTSGNFFKDYRCNCESQLPDWDSTIVKDAYGRYFSIRKANQ